MFLYEVDTCGRSAIRHLNGSESGFVKELPIRKVIFNAPTTIINWTDGTKTIVRAREGTKFSPYHGFCVALAKWMFGSNAEIKHYIEKMSGIDLDQYEAENL